MTPNSEGLVIFSVLVLHQSDEAVSDHLPQQQTIIKLHEPSCGELDEDLKYMLHALLQCQRHEAWADTCSTGSVVLAFVLNCFKSIEHDAALQMS